MFREIRVANKVSAPKSNRLKVMVAAITLVTLAGCAAEDPRSALKAEQDVQKLQSTSSASNPFNAALQANYLSLANLQLTREADSLDAGYFARKGIRASRGEMVEPENPGFWPVTQSDHTMLYQGRVTLVDALNDGGRTDEPALAAKAQVAYDCWVEGLANEPADAGQCQSDFASSMAELTKRLAEDDEEEAAPAAKPKAKKKVAKPAATAAKQLYVILFDSGSAVLSSDARSTLRKIASELRGFQRIAVTITGHADKQGPNSLNLRLSQKRASVVARELANAGVPSSAIRVMWEGEATPAVPTADGKGEQANRRVVVEVAASSR